MTVKIGIDEYVETEVHVCKTIEVPLDEILEDISQEEIIEAIGGSAFAEILETAIGPLLDDAYRAIKEGREVEAEFLFDKIYETIDRSKPIVFKDAA